MVIKSVCVVCGVTFEYVAIRLMCSRRRICSDDCRRESLNAAYKKWYDGHTEKAAASRKKIRAANPDYFKKHYAKHKELRKQQRRDWYAANKARAQQQQKAYSAAHPELIRALGRKSRSKRRAIEKKVFVEQIDPHVVFERDKGMCGICKQRVERDSPWEIDHMIPISKGGAHAYANVQLSHQACNRAKRDTLPSGQPNLFQVAV